MEAGRSSCLPRGGVVGNWALADANSLTAPGPFPLGPVPANGFASPPSAGSGPFRGESPGVFRWDHWLDQARRALRTANLARGAGEHAWACFLYQQTAQMALKGALERSGRDHQGHSVIALANDLPDGISEDVRSAARRLSRLYIPTRYPDAAGSAPAELYTDEESSQAHGDASLLLNHAEALLEGANDP